MRHLEKDNQALRTELHRVKQELTKTDQHSQKQRLSYTTHILSTRRIDVAKALRPVAAKATQEHLAAKVTISTLLPRLDVPQRVIHSINAEVSRGCTLLTNIHLPHHNDICHHHLHDQVLLNKEGVKMFAKVVKDTALGSTHSPQLLSSMEPPANSSTCGPQPPMQHISGSVLSLQQHPAQPDSYATVASRAGGIPRGRMRRWLPDPLGATGEEKTTFPSSPQSHT
ncbi:hypothetical protein AAFF_G00236450 [Aldrovandia affinis]|uniref:Uncharacterized protein n=1 Tax=Aldrovandia affinis TaxID=143900 RepID=A0AAD7W486_9TELE|nr:hypothetical protein AAFF_G00236450 [Aldrovandia affinis]